MEFMFFLHLLYGGITFFIQQYEKESQMKKPLSLCWVIILIISLLPLSAKELKKSFIPPIIKDAKILDANQITMWIINNGSFARHPENGNSGLYYPSGTEKNLVYVAGLWITGKVNGEIRTACADYNVEYQGGVILPTGLPDDPLLQKYRIYKIETGDSSDPSSANFNIDYAEWPTENGAPVDENGKPLVLGDQTIWFVINDGNKKLHHNCYNTDPLNIEVQVLAWAFDDKDTPLGQTIFIQYTIINKNTNDIKDAHVGLYVDADVGDAIDDRCACDTTLNLTYGYNGKDVDLAYGPQVPAVGFCLLQGPAVPSAGDFAYQFLLAPIENAKTLNMTTNLVFY
jgi:hypothetical protein